MSNEPKYVVIDTEGNGLFDYKKPADAEGQPRLAALSMLYVAPDLTLEREYRAFVQPVGWEMNAEATKINGLTTQYLMQHGRPVGEVLDEFCKAIEEPRVVVAHNVSHDLKHMRAELRRAGRPDQFEATGSVCTMLGLTDVCKIPPKGNRGGYKWPSLSEACVFFDFLAFGDHSAKHDAHACLMLLRKMREHGVSTTGNVGRRTKEIFDKILPRAVGNGA